MSFGVLPTVFTKDPTLITQSSFNISGSILSDGGFDIIERGFVFGTNSNPTTSDSKLQCEIGVGEYYSIVTSLNPNTTYYVRAYAINQIGVRYGNQDTLQTSQIITDIDGNSYGTIKIGNQIWMSENLRVSKYSNGVNIPNNLNDSIWQITTDGAYGIYDNNPSNNSIYGKLYNWYAASDIKKICPTGWRLPSVNDFETLTDYLNGKPMAGNVGRYEVAGGKMKIQGITYWNPNYNGTNESGFSALPAGIRSSYGPYVDLVRFTFFWTSTFEGCCPYATNISNSSTLSIGGYSPNIGASIRCLKN